jgi:hypothetical protein
MQPTNGAGKERRVAGKLYGKDVPVADFAAQVVVFFVPWRSYDCPP